MGNRFDGTDPFSFFMTKVFDAAVVSIMTLLLCIPVFTAGAALTAACAFFMKMQKNNEGPVVASYFKLFKENLKESLAGWLFLLAIGAVLFFELYIIRGQGENGSLMYGLMITVLVIYAVYLQWYFCERARFNETAVTGIANSAKFFLCFLPLDIICGVYIALLTAGFIAFPMLMIIIPFFGIAMFLYIPSFLIGKKIDRYIAERGLAKEEEPAEEMPASGRRYDYKGALAGFAVLAAAAIAVICIDFSGKDPVLNIAVVNSYHADGRTDSDIEKSILQTSATLDAEKESISYDSLYQIAYNDGDKVYRSTAANQSYYDKFFLAIRGGRIDIAIIPESFLNYCDSLGEVYDGDAIDITGTSFLSQTGIEFVGDNAGERAFIILPSGSKYRENARKFVEERFF